MKKMTRTILGVLLLSFVFTSCGKEMKLATYQLSCHWEDYTHPDDIGDPDVRDLYINFLTELSGLGLNNSWEVEIVNGRFSSEDARAEALFDSHLPELKELESSYKKKIRELGEREASSFHATVIYTLSKWVPADYSSTIMQEYSFELRYE